MKKSIILIIGIIISGLGFSIGQPEIIIKETRGEFTIGFSDSSGNLLKAPNEGLWSIATSWGDNWPEGWKHVRASESEISGKWKILKGSLETKEGIWNFRDAYTTENGLVKCIRRFEWNGDKTVDSITLAVRWNISSTNSNGFIPGLLYYGNPSEAKNRPGWVPEYGGKPGEKVLVEEHRLPIPFVCIESGEEKDLFSASLITIPSPVSGGNIIDQWWSAGFEAYRDHTEIVLLSGPVTYNGQKGIVKATQSKPLPYPDTWLTVKPGMVIEKTFYLDINSTRNKGSGFQTSLYKALDIFKPYYADDLPVFTDIIREKYEFAKSRWMESESFAGFNMYPEFSEPMIVMGWCGQASSPGYALQVLNPILKDNKVSQYVQKSLDHVSKSPVSNNGFPVRYNPQKNNWSDPDHVSQGQGMYNIAKAILAAKNNSDYNSSAWEDFLQDACDYHANRILKKDWHPRSSAEAFYVAPLTIAYQLFDNQDYLDAAIKAADHFADRHLSMTEPYWGGTLDARGEDKEGAWAAFQAFLHVYELTGKEKYLEYTKHAMDVCLSYTVVWDIPLPPGRMADHAFKTRGWTVVSPQNQHLDVYGVMYTPEIYKMGEILGDERLKKLAIVMFRSCGQIIDPYGSQGEQIQQTNFGQFGKQDNVRYMRGGYSEPWTVFWITAHFLNAAARFVEMGVEL